MSFFYYYLPINNAVSKLPNKGIVVYQTALILLGAFITYKALFQSKKTIDTIQQLSQQIKESEIAHLKSKIKCKLVTKDYQDIMRDKIVHFQEEITLMHVSNKIKCLTDGPNDPDDRTRPIKIAHLKQQQNKILANLKSEVKLLKRDIDPNQPTLPGEPNQTDEQLIHHKKVEIYRLQSEILDHLLTMKVQLEEKPANKDDINAIEQEISILKEDICQYLNDEKQSLNQQLQLPDYVIKKQLSGIEEEIEYLENITGRSQVSQCTQQHDDQERNNPHPPIAHRHQAHDQISLLPIAGGNN